jgi:hypothetical protein
VKKFLIFALLVIICGAGIIIFFFLLIGPEKKNYTTLSERSLAYIETQKLKENVFWMPVEFNDRDGGDGEVLGTHRVKITGCFSFDIPFTIRDSKQLADCTFVYSFDNPKGHMVISAKPSDETNLAEVSAVAYRRFSKGTYTESEFRTNKYGFLIFSKKEDAYEQTAFYLSNKRIFTISLVSQTNENFDTQFFNILKSLDLLY